MGERLSVWEAILAAEHWDKLERAGGELVAPHMEPEQFMGLAPKIQRRLLRHVEAKASGKAKVSLCWAPDTAPEVVEAFHAVAEAGAPNGEVGQARVVDENDHWRTTATDGYMGFGSALQGRPVTLTWSFVPDGTTLPYGNSGIGEPEADSNLRSWLQGIYGGSSTAPAAQQSWFPVFQEMFDMIEAETGLKYVYEPNDDGAAVGGNNDGILGTRGDIRISGHYIDGNSNTLAYNYYPDTGDMVIDTGDNYFNSTFGNSIRLFNVLQHEHGHGLGLPHVCPLDGTKLMEPLVTTSYRGLRFDDVYSLHRLYGDDYESHGSLTNNDSFSNAAELDISSPVDVSWLSIDDNGDSDYFKIDVTGGSQITVQVDPSTEVYLEGAQNTNGSCSSGTSFDSSAIHNLAITLYDSSELPIATVDANPAGQGESMVSVTVPSGGFHYVKVTGDSSDATQLYELQIDVAEPAIAVELDSRTMTAELFAGQNGVPDPDETVRYELTLRNNGSQTVSNLSATLTGASSFTGFTTNASYGTLADGQSATGVYVFALNGDCGDTIKLDLLVSGDGGYSVTIPLNFTLGSTTQMLDVSFDGGAGLPSGWSSSTTGAGSGWSTSTDKSVSAPRSVFAEDVGSLGQSSLQSPPVALGADPGVLRFEHWYDTEASYDGCVLEISIDGGAWQDIEDAGGTFTAGGYVGTLIAPNNPVGGRDAWYGNSGAFVTSSVTMPPASANSSVRFRWIIGHDGSVGDVGWYVDDVVLIALGCDPSIPLVDLEVLDGTASEFDAGDTGRVRLSAALPPALVFPVGLDNSGTAVIGPDAAGLDSVSIPIGVTSAEFVVTAVPDGIAEGPETLDLAPTVGTGSGIITITDVPYQDWASQLGPAGLEDPTVDFDGDGSSNIEEYAFNTDPTQASSRPSVALTKLVGAYKLTVPLGSLPADLEVSGETSTDLVSWTETGVVQVSDGFMISAWDGERFLRLVYELLSGTP